MLYKISHYYQLLSELNKTYKVIEIDDFLDDVGRTQRKNPTQYSRMHTQVLTKDGFSFELQISLKELDPIIDKSHAIYKKATYQRDSMSMDEWNKTLKQSTITMEPKSLTEIINSTNLKHIDLFLKK